MSDNQSGISVEPYTQERKEQWDRFISTGKNATFLFSRDYMEYHSDRFTDHSLILWRGGEILAVLPANITDQRLLISHGGLTYGGFVFQRAVKLCETLECFHST